VALASTLRSLFAKHSTSQRVREVEAGAEGWDRDLWRVLADAGMLALTVGTDRGGSGAGALEAVFLAAEAGRALALVPLVESDAVATTLLSAAPGMPCISEWLTASIAGDRVVVPVRLDAAGVSGRAVKGESLAVPYGSVADGFLVVAGTRVALVPRGDATEVRVQPALGPAPVAYVRFDGSPVEVVDLDEAAVEKAWAAGALAAVGIAVGGMDAVLSYAVEYATQRRQFGRPIGSFQALQHRMADMATDLERSRLLMLLAASGLECRLSDPGALGAAVAFCLDAYLRCAKSACQVLGGYGFMVEYDAQLHLRAAKSLRAAWPSRPVLEQLGDLVLAGEAKSAAL
jgi:alkylation response protein AidB-like acyl-CoA dehydrogenase